MRKKISRVGRQSSLIAKQIITFDNQQYSPPLFEPSPRKTCTREAFGRFVEVIKASAAQAGTVCLASNQIAMENRMIVIHRKPIASGAKEGIKWISLDYCEGKDYQVYAQPQVLAGERLVQQHQESISMPFLNFYVKRYHKIVIKYKNEQNIKEQRELQGPRAFAFQQSVDQLNGTILFDWRVNHGNIFFEKEASEYFPKSSAVVEQYALDLKKVFEEYPQLIRKVENFKQKREAVNTLQDQPLPFQGDYFRRLMKHYAKEMSLLPLRLQAKNKSKSMKPSSSRIDVKILK